MSLRSSSMELSDPATPDTSIEVQDTSNRRKSGRARHKPVLLSQDPNLVQPDRAGSAKRKLAEVGDDGIEDAQQADESDADSNPEEEEEQVKPRKKAAKREKPAQKRPKPNKGAGAGASKSLPVRPAVNGVRKTVKARKTRPQVQIEAIDETDGLYGRHDRRSQ